MHSGSAPTRTWLVPALCIAVLATCAPDQGSSLGWGSDDGLGVRERCDGAAGAPIDCGERAERAIVAITTSLGPPYPGPGMVTPDESARAAVTYERRAGFRWAAADGATGEATEMAIDLERYLRGDGVAYAVLQTPSGVVRYEVPDALAEELLRSIWIRAD